MNRFRIVGDGSVVGTHIYYGDEEVLFCRLLEINTDPNNRDGRLRPIVKIELIQCDIDINNMDEKHE